MGVGDARPRLNPMGPLSHELVMAKPRSTARSSPWRASARSPLRKRRRFSRDRRYRVAAGPALGAEIPHREVTKDLVTAASYLSELAALSPDVPVSTEGQLAAAGWNGPVHMIPGACRYD